MRTLEQMKANAQRQLDGMTCNRDMMAKDVAFLTDVVARYQQVVADLNKRLESAGAPNPQMAAWDEFLKRNGIRGA